MMERAVLLWGVLTVFITVASSQSCTMPSNLHNKDWVRGRDKQTLSFNDTHVTGLDVPDSSSTIHPTFECFILSGTELVVKSSTSYSAALSGNQAYLYMCMDLRQLGANSYYVYEKTDPNTNLGNHRAVTKLATDTVVASDVCTKQASEVPFFSLVQSGTSFQQTCPDVIRGRYNYTYTDHGGTDFCSGNSELNVCADTSKPTFDYTKCSTTMMGSTGGILSCIGSVTSGSSTFVLLYNEDASASVQYSCVVIEQQTDTSYMSYLPNYCDPAMTPTTSVSGGGRFVLKHLELCPVTSPTDGPSPSPTGAIAGGVVVAIVALAAVVVVAIYFIKKRQKVSTVPNTPMDGESSPPAEKSATANGEPPGQTPKTDSDPGQPPLANGNAPGVNPDPESPHVNVQEGGNRPPMPARLPPLPTAN